MSEMNLLPYVIVEEVEGESDEKVTEEEFDPDVELLMTVARLLSFGPWLPCPIEDERSYKERLQNLGENLSAWKRSSRSKEEDNRMLTEKLNEWEMRYQVLETRMVQRTREFEEIEVELERMKKASQPVPNAAMEEVNPPRSKSNNQNGEATAEGERAMPISSKKLKDMGVQTSLARVVLVVEKVVQVEAERDEPEEILGPLDTDSNSNSIDNVFESLNEDQNDEIEQAETPTAVSINIDVDNTGEPVPPGPKSYNLRRRLPSWSTAEEKVDGKKKIDLKRREATITIDEDLAPVLLPKESALVQLRRNLRRRFLNPNGTSRKTTDTTSSPIVKQSMPPDDQKTQSSRLTRFRATMKSKLTTKAGPATCETVEATGQFQCDSCGKSLSSEKNLNRHKKEIHERPVKGRYCCKFCKKRFSYKSYFSQHLKTHTRKQIYKCKTCGKSMQSPHSLKRHLETHERHRKRDFVCPTCDKAYFTQGDLAQHMMAHQENKPFKCPRCPMRFKLNKLLGKHLKTHSDRKPFRCQHCDSSYKRAYDLTVHLRKHTGERPFPCQMCQQSFRRASHLKVHVLQIHREGRVEEDKPYKCPVCGEGYTRKANCKKHQRERHPIEVAVGGGEDDETNELRRSRRRRME